MHCSNVYSSALVALMRNVARLYSAVYAFAFGRHVIEESAILRLEHVTKLKFSEESVCRPCWRNMKTLNYGPLNDSDVTTANATMTLHKRGIRGGNSVRPSVTVCPFGTLDRILFYCVKTLKCYPRTFSQDICIFSAHLTLLDRTLAVDVCPSVLCQTRGLWQNEIILSQYINAVR